MRTSAVLAASALAIGVAACYGSSGGSDRGSATKTVTASQTTGQNAPAANQSAPVAAQSAPVVTQQAPTADDNSRSAGKSNAASPDSVSKVGSYYRAALAGGGWQLRSFSNSPWNASFTAHAPTRA